LSINFHTLYLRISFFATQFYRSQIYSDFKGTKLHWKIFNKRICSYDCVWQIRRLNEYHHFINTENMVKWLVSSVPSIISIANSDNVCVGRRIVTTQNVSYFLRTLCSTIWLHN